MKDERKLCTTCRHEHAWGILRYSDDNVSLYGARRCEVQVEHGRLSRNEQGEDIDICGCDSFVEAIPGEENLPALSQPEIKDIWARTSFLGAQVPLATRIAVAQIMSLGKDENPATAMIHQWPEFMGLMISQITDIRGAMTRDENKFAHLVAHTDEIVESMRGVVQLSERLATIVAQNERMAEHIAELQAEVAQFRGSPEKPSSLDEIVPRWEGADVCMRVGCGHIKDVHRENHNRCYGYDSREAPPCECGGFTRTTEVDHIFTECSRPLRNEPIATDADPANEDEDDHD